jgi:hypothetical protein
VEQYDWQHSKRPKSVYLSSIVHSFLSVVCRWFCLLVKLLRLGTMMIVLTIISFLRHHQQPKEHDYGPHRRNHCQAEGAC